MADDFDVSQFKEIFVSESKEHLSVLNANLLELEKNPSARDLLNEVFRAAHTLKGMAATMGFDKVTELTHTMENLLDKLRSGKIEAKAESIDILFDCFDSLESLLDEIVSGQDKGINIQALVQKLKNMDSAAVAAAPQPAVKAEKIVPAENIAGQTAPPPPQKTEPAAPAERPTMSFATPTLTTAPVDAEREAIRAALVLTLGREPSRIAVTMVQITLAGDSRGVASLADLFNGTVEVFLDADVGGTVPVARVSAPSGSGPIELEMVSDEASLAPILAALLATNFRVGIRGSTARTATDDFDARIDVRIGFAAFE